MTQSMLDSILTVDFPKLLSFFQSAFVFLLVIVFAILTIVLLSHFVQSLKQQKKKRRSYQRASSVPRGQVSGVRAYSHSGSRRTNVRGIRR